MSISFDYQLSKAFNLIFFILALPTLKVLCFVVIAIQSQTLLLEKEMQFCLVYQGTRLFVSGRLTPTPALAFIGKILNFISHNKI